MCAATLAGFSGGIWASKVWGLWLLELGFGLGVRDVVFFFFLGGGLLLLRQEL